MSKDKPCEKIVFFCDGKKCCRYNEDVKSTFNELISTCGLAEAVVLKKMKCQGMCKKAPIFYLPENDKYKKEVSVSKAQKIFEKYIVAAEELAS
ncbi:MAG: (2Fe-2S) ferredoxin domain-containing protein [Flavobacterium sp.]|nr:(2Fe-2S) ferredoxin domain-containing protein [Candidatus Neoflavobacterium equi]